MPTLFTQISPLKPEKDITLTRGCLQLAGVFLLALAVIAALLWTAWRIWSAY